MIDREIIYPQDLPSVGVDREIIYPSPCLSLSQFLSWYLNFSGYGGIYYRIPLGTTVTVQTNHQYFIKNHLYMEGGHIITEGNAQIFII